MALVGSYELLMMIIRSAQAPADAVVPWVPDRVPDADPLQVQAAQVFADELAEDRVPSARAIRARLSSGVAGLHRRR
jgi:hypothetical protein